MGKLTKPMRKRRNYMRSYLESGISTLQVKRNSSGSNGSKALGTKDMERITGHINKRTIPEAE